MSKRKAPEQSRQRHKPNPADYYSDNSDSGDDAIFPDVELVEISKRHRKLPSAIDIADDVDEPVVFEGDDESNDVDNSDLVSSGSGNRSILSKDTTVSTNSTMLAEALINQNLPDIQKMKNMPLEKFREVLKDKLKRWKINEQDRITFQELIRLGFENFGLQQNILHRQDIERGFDAEIIECTALYRYVAHKELESEIDPEFDLPYNTVINKISEVIHNVFRAVNHLYSAAKATSKDYDYSMNDDNYVFRYAPIKREELNELQLLLIHIKNCLYEDDLRKYEEDIYRKHFNGDGYFTHYWEKHCSIKEYIYTKTQLEYFPDAWAWSRKKGVSNITSVERLLIDGKESELPVLVRNRRIYSFTNGVYITRANNETFNDYFHYFDAEDTLPDQFVACKRFDVPFHNEQYLDEMTEFREKEADWYRIKTPYLQKLLEFQYRDNPEMEQIIRWFYIFIGRMLYANGELDNWQVMPVLQGVAATGKGVIINSVLKQFYEAADIGIMNNNVDQKFGISTFASKKIWLGLDIDKKWTIDKTTLLSMISAEDVAANVKYRVNPLNIYNFPVPGILATNEEIGFQDSGGSISRRLITFVFKNKVPEKQKDPELGNKIKMEIAEIIKKCNLAYLWAVKRYAKVGVHSVMPEYFRKGKEKLQLETDPIFEFMSTLDLCFTESNKVRRWIPVQVLEQKYKEWCQETGQFRPVDFGKCNVYSAIATLKEKYEKDIDYVTKVDDPLIVNLWYPRDPKARRRTKFHRAIIEGIDLAENCGFEEENIELVTDVAE